MSREVEEIKSKIDIAEFIGGYIKLIKAGASYKALCPFHNEKTPSMIISPQKQIWHCFGCGAGGDVFSFLTKMEGLEFPDALKMLAEKTGVALSRTDYGDRGKKDKFYRVCSLAMRYWHKILLESSPAKEAKKYIIDRGLTEETLEDFQIGYALDSWDNLMSFLKKKGFTEQEIFLAGLTVKKDRASGYYDRFRDRLMFPIHNLAGQVVGFGGRVLKSGETAKYINTPQTLVYNKSLILFGLYQAKEAIKQEDVCVLVEGYLDVIPSHQAGIKNVVSISGTALTIEQIKILKRYTKNLALALDMDLAGQKAADRSIDLALQEEMNVKVIEIPGAKDPGECIANNPAGWREAIKNARQIMEYYFDKELLGRDLNDPSARKESIRRLLEKISRLGSQLDQDYWLKKLAERISITESVLREEIKTFSRPNYSKADIQPVVAPVVNLELNTLNRIMALAFISGKNLSHIVDNLKAEFIFDTHAGEVYKEVVLCYNQNEKTLNSVSKDKGDFDLFDSLHERFKSENLENQPAAKIVEEAFLLSQKDYKQLDAREARREIDILIKSLKDHYITREIARLNGLLEQAEKNGEQEKIETFSNELNNLIHEKRS